MMTDDEITLEHILKDVMTDGAINTSNEAIARRKKHLRPTLRVIEGGKLQRQFKGVNTAPRKPAA